MPVQSGMGGSGTMAPDSTLMTSWRVFFFFVFFLFSSAFMGTFYTVKKN
jgi:hypothetical protein